MTCQLYPKCRCLEEGDGRGCMTKILQSVGSIQHIPPHWVKIAATDFGVNNFAYCLLLWDRDTDTVHVHDSWKMTNLFLAGNQSGKTEAGAFEIACHLTGMYPDWWTMFWEPPKRKKK